MKYFNEQLMAFYKEIMPSMSQTEREALEAGTVGFEKELFNGSPDIDAFLAKPKAVFTSDEQHFFKQELNQLCALINDWEVTHTRMDLSPDVWSFIRTKGFLGLIIPKEYGGKAFSASAVVEVLTRLSSKSITASTTVGVANSLGPAELLLHYGTEEQKKYYLPRLANGTEIPCFALTGPNAGSDAASIPDMGVVCRRKWNGKMTVGVNLNWNKRYITLCPVATIMGMAFHLVDPEHLLGDKEDIGITCALIPSDTQGITRGRRHFPLGTAFLNGPTQGKDVFIPLDWIIGGVAMAGAGWKMLMQCLSAGRAIALPSGAAGNAQVAAMSSGAYARIRQQFGLPIAHFEGIEAALAKIGGYTYIINAGLSVTAAIIDSGEKPSILSAILKCYATELARKVMIEAMDVHGGKAICLGPKNYLARGYEASPISITVEGANILTRNLIIYGQGAVRCHPSIQEEINSIQANDLSRFHTAVFKHMQLFFVHIGRVFKSNLSVFFYKKSKNKLSFYKNRITNYSTKLAFISDLAMIFLGSQLKRKERISARLADGLSYLYLCSAVLKRYQDDGSEDDALLHWSCQTLLFNTEEALCEIFDNLPQRHLLQKGLMLFLKCLVFLWGKQCKKPSDMLEHDIAELLTHDTDARERLTRHVFKESVMNNPLGELELAFKKILAAETVERKMIQALKKSKITLSNYMTREERINLALNNKLITKAEAKILIDAEVARQAVLAVDDFATLKE